MVAMLRPALQSAMLSPREAMIETQLRPGAVRDERVLAAMGSVAREAFVPASLRGVAYIDEDLEIAPGRWLMEPLAFARLVEALALTPRDRVLIVGAGAGYSAAVASQLAGDVVALEEDTVLADLARRALTGFAKVEVVTGKLAQGWPVRAPYDAILFNGAVQEIPPLSAQEQLKEGGRIALALQIASRTEEPGSGLGKLMVGAKLHGTLALRRLADASVKLLPGLEAREGFRF